MCCNCLLSVVHLLLFEEFKMLNAPFFSVFPALISGKPRLQQSRKSARPALPSVRCCLVLAERDAALGRGWFAQAHLLGKRWLLLRALPGPAREASSAGGIPAVFAYFIVFSREDGGFLQGCVGGCLACGLCQCTHLHVLLWCFGSKHRFGVGSCNVRN